MARRGLIRPVARGPRRKTVWLAGGMSETTVAAANTAVLVAQLNAAALALWPFTIVRTRGYFSIRSDATAADESYAIAYGQAVVRDQASAIGVTAIPTPVTDQGSDAWFVWEFLDGRFDFGDASGVAELGHRRVLDSKAMRKVDLGDDVVTVVESPSFGTGQVVVDTFRMLIKLH